jgi:hypothetical protein
VNSGASVVVRVDRVDVCFVTASHNMRRIIASDREQRYAFKFSVKLLEGATYTCEKIFRKRLVTVHHHVLKYFGGTKTLQMGEKRWKMNRDLDPPLCEYKHKRRPCEGLHSSRSTFDKSNDRRRA